VGSAIAAAVPKQACMTSFFRVAFGGLAVSSVAVGTGASVRREAPHTGLDGLDTGLDMGLGGLYDEATHRNREGFMMIDGKDRGTRGPSDAVHIP
jgi:hypothetical protein